MNTTQEKEKEKVVVHNTVTEVKNAYFSEKLREVVQTLDFDKDIPDEAQVVFHNSVRGFDFGGWTSGNYPTKTDQASLFFNNGPVYSEDEEHTNQIDLTPRKMGGWLGIGKESIKEFAIRILEEAKQKLDDAKYFRNYTKESRYEAICCQLEKKLLLDKNLSDIRAGVLQVYPNYFIKNYGSIIIMVDPNEIKKATSILSRNDCINVPLPSNSDHALLLFDGIPVQIRSKDLLRKTIFASRPNVYSNPQIFEFKE